MLQVLWLAWRLVGLFLVVVAIVTGWNSMCEGIQFGDLPFGVAFACLLLAAVDLFVLGPVLLSLTPIERRGGPSED